MGYQTVTTLERRYDISKLGIGASFRTDTGEGITTETRPNSVLLCWTSQATLSEISVLLGKASAEASDVCAAFEGDLHHLESRGDSLAHYLGQIGSLELVRIEKESDKSAIVWESGKEGRGGEMSVLVPSWDKNRHFSSAPFFARLPNDSRFI